jgi:hypothetical protein
MRRGLAESEIQTQIAPKYYRRINLLKDIGYNL